MSPKLALPFAHLNLRRNPFGEAPLSQWPALAVLDVEPLARRLREPPFCVQLIGEKGRGKTTHLLSLRALFSGAPYVHLPEDEPLPPIPEAPVVFVDETQRLSRRARARLFGRARALAIGTHEDHAIELRRAGIPFETVRVGGLDAERLGRIVARRIEWARRAPGPVPRVSATVLAALIARLGDDVRAITHELYEAIQRQREIGDVEV